MKELVIKRQANVTSADALDEINAAYPDAEVLSFRRVRDAASEADLFVTRIRVAVMDEVAAPEDDVVVEGKQHEEEEEAMMREMLDLLREVKNIVSDEEEDEEPKAEKPERIETEEELEREHKAKPLPEPSEPPFGAAGVGQMMPVASLVVQRPATVSKTAARLELIREFSDAYEIGKIEKHDGMFVASLHKIGESDIAEQMKSIQNALDTNTDPKTGKPLGQKQRDRLQKNLMWLNKQYQNAAPEEDAATVADEPQEPIVEDGLDALIDAEDLDRYEGLAPEETEVPTSEEMTPEWPWMKERSQERAQVAAYAEKTRAIEMSIRNNIDPATGKKITDPKRKRILEEIVARMKEQISQSNAPTPVTPWAALQFQQQEQGGDMSGMDWSGWAGISDALRNPDYIKENLLPRPEFLRGRQQRLVKTNPQQQSAAPAK